MQQLKNFVAISKAFPTATFKVGGYTDSTGSDQVNVALSQKRSDIVAATVVKLGASTASIVGSKGYGKEWPIADNSTKEGQAQNRRVAVNVKSK
jgi:outer membrane protein OmpA-like peptidoglycan-associated protein